MTTILVDARYIGSAIKYGRSNAAIVRQNAARIFGVTMKEYQRIERGEMLPPGNMMTRLMSLGFLQLRTRQFNGANTLLPLKPDPDEIVIVSEKKI